MVRQIRAQLKKIAITDKMRVDEMFLRYDQDRTGFIDANNMRNLCRSLQLPVDDDVINAVSISKGDNSFCILSSCINTKVDLNNDVSKEKEINLNKGR